MPRTSTLLLTLLCCAGIAHAQNPSVDALRATPRMLEVRASFPGGDTAMSNYIIRTVQYPRKAIRQNAQGTVLVQFMVEKDGSITEAHAVNTVHPLLDAEAVRVIASMPRWRPSTQLGKAVRTTMKLPVTFKLE